MRNFVFVLIAVVTVLVIVTVYPPNPTATVPDNEVKAAGTFDECVKDGNPILETYPPSCKTKDGKIITQNVGNETTLRDIIRIDTPRPVQKVESPLKITGEARGNWFFEAQFSAKMLGEKGEIIGEGIMTADSGWMTEEFVPFAGEITFNASDSARGKLILEKANPSGLMENNETLIVPVVFR